MKRDMDLMRKILLALEAGTSLNDIADEHTVDFHCELLIDAGLLRGNVRRHMSGMDITLIQHPITYAGHDFLDAIRNESVWKDVLAKGGSLLGGVGLDVLTTYAKHKTCELLGLPPQG